MKVLRRFTCFLKKCAFERVDAKIIFYRGLLGAEVPARCVRCGRVGRLELRDQNDQGGYAT